MLVGRLFSWRLLRRIFWWFGITRYDRAGDAPDPDEYDTETDEPDDDGRAPVHRFCRLLTRGSQPNERALIELGLLMETESGSPDDDRESRTPAGYTYRGQSIDHDITFDRDTPLTVNGAVEPETIETFARRRWSWIAFTGAGRRILLASTNPTNARCASV